MDKYTALSSFFAKKPRISNFRKMIVAEAWDVQKRWKKDCFAPPASELAALPDAEFVAKYQEDFDNTVEHELAEIVEIVDNFATAHGVNVFDHYEALKKYRKLSMPDKTTIILTR